MAMPDMSQYTPEERSMFALEAQVSLLTKIERTLSTLLLLTQSMLVLGLLGGAGIIVVTAAK